MMPNVGAIIYLYRPHRRVAIRGGMGDGEKRDMLFSTEK